MNTTHALVIGARGVGKSTLIRRVLDELGQPVFGFETKKEDSLADGLLGSPVYLYPAGAAHRRTPENLAAHCGIHGFHAYRPVFDRYALRLNAPIPTDRVILMDELGFLEAVSDAFCGAVLHLLDGDIPVIAAVKDRDTPFLNAVRSHPNCKHFFITSENRDALFHEVLYFMRTQTARRGR